MTTQSIAEKLQNWLERLSRARDRQTYLSQRLEAEKGKIVRLEAKIKKWSVYKNFYEREVKE